jgi:hypothetical protein
MLLMLPYVKEKSIEFDFLQNLLKKGKKTFISKID